MALSSRSRSRSPRIDHEGIRKHAVPVVLGPSLPEPSLCVGTGPAEEIAQRSRPPPFLCVIQGGPGSGKTSLGAGLHNRFPGLCHASGGDVARLATTDDARKSPLLNSIGRQLADTRRRKVATKRLVEFVTAVLVDGLQRHPGFVGMVVDGVRIADLDAFERAHRSRVACLIRIDCPRTTLLSRLGDRESREGDERLGLCDGSGADPVAKELFNKFQTKDRVDAYFERVSAEDQAMRAHFGTAGYAAVVHPVCGDLTPDEVLTSAMQAMHKAAASAMDVSESESSQEDWVGVLKKAEMSLPVACKCGIDWSMVVKDTAARLDREFYPDGRPRNKAP